MIKAPLPANELARLDTLYRYHILDTDTEQAFNDLARLAAQICQTPIALISLCDRDRQWFKANIGLTISETSRNIAFCAHAILQDELLVIPDALGDPRFEANPLVTDDPKIRFYAGAPLITPNGHRLGTLCILDRIPRQLQAEQLEALQTLSRQVVHLLELRRNLTEQEHTAKERERLFNLSPNMMCTATLDGYFIHLNSAWQQTLGYSLEELKQTALIDLVHPEDRADTLAKFQQLAWDGITPHFENRYRCQDGSYKWLAWTAISVIESGFVHALVRDVTERKQSEIALSRLAAIVESSGDAIISKTLEGIVTSWNGSAERIFGYSAEEMVGQSITLLIPADRQDEEPKILEKLKQGQRIEHFETVRKHKDGTLIQISLTISPIRDANGQVIGASKIARDITAYKQAVEALRQSEHHLSALLQDSQARFQTFMNHSPTAAWITDVNGQMLYASPTYYHTFDLPISDVVGQSVSDIYASEFAQQFLEKIRTVASTHQMLETIESTPRVDGSIGDFLVYRFPISDTSGQYLIGGVAIDITEHKKAEEALRQQAKRERIVNGIAQQMRQSLDLDEILSTTVSQVQQFLQADRVLTYRIDSNGTGTVTHEAIAPDCFPILGQTLPEEIFPIECHTLYRQGRIRAITDIEQDEMSDCLAETLRQLGVQSKLVVPILYKEELWGLLIAHQCRQSREWQQWEIELLKQLSTQVAIAIQQSQLYQQVQLELLERKRTEQKNQEQAALLDVATDAIFVRDLSSHILYWNKGAERLYGWTAAEACGKSAIALLYREYPTNHQEIHQAIVQTGEWHGELQQMTKDNRELMVESRWTLVRGRSGEPKAILVVNTDITQKKLLERQFLRSQRVESIGTLASGIAHDVNNILAPILMSVQLLRMKLSDPESEQWLDILENNSRRGSELIKQVLSFARGMDGKHGVLQIRHLISEIKQVVEETFPRSIHIYTHVPHELWTISGDATQLHQVLMNLCVNARDAMPEGGTLSIKAKNLVMNQADAQLHLEARAGAYVAIFVSDTGMGIPEALLDRVFEPFFTTKEINQGTGLGLSTVMGIVKSHQGFITVSSKRGAGTEFQIFLPAIDAEETAIADETELFNGQGEWILVVDDEAPIREMTRNLLKTYGYKVLTASNGIEAIALYAQHQEDINLALVDLMMPEMDGITTIHALRTINAKVKIITSSGLLSGTELPEAERAYVHSFLPKPYTSQELLHSIYNALKE